jgi:hypothetical protein
MRRDARGLNRPTIGPDTLRSFGTTADDADRTTHALLSTVTR